MLTIYDAVEGKLVPARDTSTCGPNAVWIDMLNPTDVEDALIEAALGIDVPTRSEMREIEASNRFYTENGAVYMTAIVLHNSSGPVPMTSALTFILAGNRLVTVRYAEPKAFGLFASRACKSGNGGVTGPEIMIGLVEMLIERQADLIERVQDEVETMAPKVFGHLEPGQRPVPRRLDELLRTIGREGDIVARGQESAASLARLLNFGTSALRTQNVPQAILDRFLSAAHDIGSLMESLRYLSGRTAFLLDATLGMISTEQNQIIKLFSVMAVMLMPPTLVASIYGMNFRHMPELEWPYGYPMALGLMVIAAVIPFLYFRRKGWL
jgi:magnesium transporter